MPSLNVWLLRKPKGKTSSPSQRNQWKPEWP